MRVYKVIPGPSRLHFDQNDLTFASAEYQDILNEQAKQGWIFDSMQEIEAHQDARQKRGCFGSKEMQAEKNVTMFLLIFYSDVEEKPSETPLATPEATPTIDDVKGSAE